MTLDIAAEPSGVLRMGDAKAVRVGEDVTVHGFPNYGGGPESITPATVTQVVARLFAERLFLSVPIYLGNSGGPVLNKNFEVVGVVQYGWDLAKLKKLPEDKVVVQSSAIRIDVLARLKKPDEAGAALPAGQVDKSPARAAEENPPDQGA
jgi:hypothetical protein